jgi:transcriptional regulator with XRE-family HTH domain
MKGTDVFSRDDDRFVNLWLMVRLHQIAKNYESFDAFLLSSGVSKGALWKIMRGEGNPTFGLVQRLAASQNMTFLELLGLEEDVVKDQLGRLGVDADLLANCSKGVATNRKALTGMLKQVSQKSPSPPRRKKSRQAK